jgi:hypothetical protein
VKQTVEENIANYGPIGEVYLAYQQLGPLIINLLMVHCQQLIVCLYLNDYICRQIGESLTESGRHDFPTVYIYLLSLPVVQRMMV